MKKIIKNIPILRSIARFFYFTFVQPFKSFSGSEDYWIKRYNAGGNSGSGSYDKFAKFKADILNTFVSDKEIKMVIEYGCGDGNQLKLSNYPSYIGFDVSENAISTCKSTFKNDESKTFKLVNEYANEKADLVLSLDVIYHLIEDEVYSNYMKRLFDSSSKFVIIYSSNTDNQNNFQASHVKHRNFSIWIKMNKPKWQLTQHIPNIYPNADDDIKGSSADFYIYKLNL